MEFPPMKNTLILRAARGEHVDKVPVWIMRQAGRYLPEYRKLHEKYDFFTICRTPELSCEATLMPVLRYDVDAAIIFSDILVILQAMGMTVEMKPGVGPVILNPVKQPEDYLALKPNIKPEESLGYVLEAITMTRKALDGKVPLIGFAGGPWTLFCYMIEGGGSKTMSRAKSWLYKYPSLSFEILHTFSSDIARFLIAQAKAGAQMLQVFESNAGYLTKDHFMEFCYPQLVYISQTVKHALQSEGLDVPLIVFAKGAHYALHELSKAHYDVISIDWTMVPTEARKEVGSDITLQGNLDPCALYASEEDIRMLTQRMVSLFGKQRYIANLGHGIYPDVDPDRLSIMINTVHNF